MKTQISHFEKTHLLFVKSRIKHIEGFLKLNNKNKTYSIKKETKV